MSEEFITLTTRNDKMISLKKSKIAMVGSYDDKLYGSTSNRQKRVKSYIIMDNDPHTFHYFQESMFDIIDRIQLRG